MGRPHICQYFLHAEWALASRWVHSYHQHFDVDEHGLHLYTGETGNDLLREYGKLVSEDMMRQTWLVVMALVAGFAGGVLSTRVMPTRAQLPTAEILRAHSFELVDGGGKTISYWGIDKGQNAVLTFGSHWPAPPPGGRSVHSVMGLKDPETQRATIGVIDDDPFLYLTAADGKTRVRLYLSDYGKPILLMEDETGPRLSLGIEQSDTPGPQDNDWTLDFGPDSRARIGVYAEKEKGQRYVRGIFAVKREKLKYPPQQEPK